MTSRSQLDASLRIRLSDGREGMLPQLSLGPFTGSGSGGKIDGREIGWIRSAARHSHHGDGNADRRQAHLDDDARMDVVSNHQAMSDVGKEVVPVVISKS